MRAKTFPAPHPPFPHNIIPPITPLGVPPDILLVFVSRSLQSLDQEGQQQMRSGSMLQAQGPSYFKSIHLFARAFPAYSPVASQAPYGQCFYIGTHISFHIYNISITTVYRDMGTYGQSRTADLQSIALTPPPPPRIKPRSSARPFIGPF